MRTYILYNEQDVRLGNGLMCIHEAFGTKWEDSTQMCATHMLLKYADLL